MANLNKVMLIGRLTRDPEVRTFSTGGKVAKFGFAVNNRKKNNQTGQWEDDPVFIDCEVFNRGENGRQADLVEQNLRKGQQVFIEGHLRLDKWQDKNDGSSRQRLVVVIDNFQFLEPRAEGMGGGEGGATRAPRMATAARRPQPQPSYNGGDSYGEPDADLDGGGSNGNGDDIPF
jgi:single-strand DNA-binding protein